MAADATISFDISLDLGKIKTAVNDATRKVHSEFKRAFSQSAQGAQSSCDEMAKAFKKISPAADETRAKINAILDDTEKSMKSKASSIAWIYRKQGMNQSEAMKKAWSEIERVSRSGSDQVKKDIKGIGSQGNSTANELKFGLLGTLKKIGVAMLAAFTVKKLVDFSAQCIELGSDLAEVQNVVDVTFPQMSRQIDSFAKEAITSFGLSETMAKKFTGTFGAMAKAFGFSEKSAYEMSTTLTGLAGDVASFYNISQDEAYTKLKSVFTGETETLKDLGIVMTQSALDAYAMANGYGKTTKSMSEMEKVALRYKFVQDQLTLASGDFIRTSDGWANQVRVLKLQFDSLKATLGQGLINVLTPVIQVINTIISKLMSLANAFKAFTEMVTGKKSGGGASAAAAGMEAVAASADKAGAAAGGAGSAAKKAAQDMKSVTTGIDELNIIDQGNDSSGGSGGGAGGYEADQFDMGELDSSAVDEMDSKYAGLIEKANELKNLFMAGFKVGFGDMSVLDSMKESIQSIKDSLTEIFTSPEVEQAATRFVNILAINLGKIAGSAASVGASIADFLVGSIAKYLDQNKDFIEKKLVALFDAGSEIAKLAGSFAQALGKIFEVLRLDSFQQIGADIIAIFGNTFLNVTELLMNFSSDLIALFVQPIIDNKDKIVEALSGLADFLAPIIGLITDAVSYVGQKINDLYNGVISPVFGFITTVISDAVGLILDAFNAWLVPALQKAGEAIQALRNGPFAGLAASFDKLIEAVSKFVQIAIASMMETWETKLKPFAEWFIDTLAPYISAAFEVIIEVFSVVVGAVADFVTGVIDVLTGIITFLTENLNVSWQEVWNGIINCVSNAWITIQTKTSAVWNAIKSFIDGLWNNIKSLASTLFNTIKTSISAAWENVKSKTSEIWEGIKEFVSGLWDTVKTTAETTFTNLKDSVVGVWNTLKEETKRIWDGIWADIKGIINMIINGVESMANRVIDAINAMIEAVNEVADKVPGIGAELIPKIPNIHLPRLAQGGFVRANTPQLAMIGDNRHYGEIVAPEDKMQEMVDRAVALATQNSSGGMSEYYLASMVELLKNIVDLIEQMDLTVTIDIRELKKKLVELDARSGYKLRTT